MSLPDTPLHRATTNQISILTKSRNESGAHIYYTSGHRADVKQLNFDFAGTFIEGSRLIIAFEYKGPLGSEKYPIFYGLYNRHDQTYLRIDFSTDYAFEHRYDGGLVPVTVNKVSSAILGFHVVEYRRTASSIQVYLDGELLFPGDKPLNQPQWMRVFYTEKPGKAPFVFWESHCNMTDPLEAMKRMGLFTFKHENISIVIGGCALYLAEWPRNIIIYLKILDKEVGRIDSAGLTACLLKVYRLGYIFTNAEHQVKVPVITNWPWRNAPEIPLSGLNAFPLPNKVVDLRIVCGHFNA
ncbi:uncharacterized protein [Dermacentor albipictus]|uniref:uncharacterized protein isoform X1 n=1 Tax=Dermacentor albipictus TaxID=60249 RepID=UPI0031FCC522